MRIYRYILVLVATVCWLFSLVVAADPAVDALGQDYVFPNRIEGLPAKLSDFESLEINYFHTNDDVKLAYWEAGEGEPVIFIPGWSANGAEYINVLYLLSKKYHVYVLDPRNQGLSQAVEYGSRISRYSMDLKQFVEHLGLTEANFCGWSMGASVLWGYIDLFGTESINKLVLIDEPISIYTHSDWSEEERLNAGGMTTSVERMIDAFGGAPTNSQLVDMNVMARYAEQESLYFQNSEKFASEVVQNNFSAMSKVLFDHGSNDWRDVVGHKINVPTAIFTGEYSNNLPSQQWAYSVIPKAQLFVYRQAEQGDHFLAFKNPVKFVRDLDTFFGAQ